MMSTDSRFAAQRAVDEGLPDGVVFFDGVCNLCSGVVQFIVDHDSVDRFRFASLQSPLAKRIFGDAAALHTIYLFEEQSIFSESTAALRIAGRMRGLWKLLPIELEIDTFEGQAYVGLVPFTMTGVRPTWAPRVRALSDFHETNVRTYVHYRGRDPGVWFFSLDAASQIAVGIARTFSRLPYHHARMSLQFAADGSIEHRTSRRTHTSIIATAAVTYRPTGSPSRAMPGTLEHFLVERYYLYTRNRRGRILRGQVHHEPYPLQGAAIEQLDESLLVAAGLERPNQQPLAHYAAGVTVDVFGLKDAARESTAR